MSAELKDKIARTLAYFENVQNFLNSMKKDEQDESTKSTKVPPFCVEDCIFYKESEDLESCQGFGQAAVISHCFLHRCVASTAECRSCCRSERPADCGLAAR